MGKLGIRLNAYWLDFVAGRLWPLLRRRFESQLSPRCSRCILPLKNATDHGEMLCEQCLAFSDQSGKDGVLNPPTAEDNAFIDQAIRENMGKGLKYDAMVLFSGGKDSTYMLDRLVRDYPGLRIVAVMVDTGFTSPIALSNAQEVMKKIKVEWLLLKPDLAFLKKTFRIAFKSIPKQRRYSIVDFMDGHMIFDAARVYATKNEIPLILCGLSRVQMVNIFGAPVLEKTEREEMNPLVRDIGLKLEEYFTPEEMRNWYTRKGQTFLPRFILPMVAWFPTEEQIVELVTKRGYLKKRNTAPLVTNNGLIPVIGVAEVNTFGVSSFEVEFAKTIRAGMAPRDYWLNLFQMLEFSAKTGRFLGPAVERVLRELSLTHADIGIRR